MANYNTLKSNIQSIITTNGNNEITGALLQSLLVSMVNSLGAGYQFMGIATPETNPGTPDQRVFYIAKENGIYSNFNSIVVENEVVFLMYDSAWSKVESGMALLESILMESGNLYTTTMTGKYINASGVVTSNSGYNSCQLPMTGGRTYRTYPQTVTSGGCPATRVFKVENDTYTQVYYKIQCGGYVEYKCPNDGYNYIIQLVEDKNRGVGTPAIREVLTVAEVATVLQQQVEDLIASVPDWNDAHEKSEIIFHLFDKTANLALTTGYGGYYNQNGAWVNNASYNSCLIPLENGSTYYIHQGYTTNNVRIFAKVGNVLTQITSFTGGSPTYTVPSDSTDYLMQVVYTLAYGAQSVWVSKDSALTEWVSPYTLIELGSVRSAINTLSTQVGQNTMNIATINAEIHSPDLWQVTIQNGYINESGTQVANNSYDACVTEMIPGHTYQIKMQTVSSGDGNYMRVFRVDNGTYTQVYKKQSNGGTFNYTCLDNGNTYVLQVVKRKNSGDGPNPQIHDLTVDLMANVESLVNKTQPLNRIRIFCIGNSYTRDAMMYMPFVLEEILPGVEVEIGIMYQGSATLSDHYTKISTNANYANFDHYKTGESWSTETSKTVDYGLGIAEWDIIMLQQQSSASRNYSTYQPYLNDIVTLLLGKLNHPVKIGFFLTPALPDGASTIGSDTSDEMFAKIVTAVQRVIDETAVEFAIPVGTAVQNARTTTLDSLGDFGHLSYDGLHLQEGIPCLLEAYVAAMYYAGMIGLEKGVFGSQIRPTQEWVTANNIIQQDGTSVGVTDANCYIAQKCAAIAMKKPYVITDLTTLNI